MGCQASIAISNTPSLSIPTPRYHSKTHVFPKGIILPTTVGLENMLKQSHLRDNMRRFILTSWLTATNPVEALPSYSIAGEPFSLSPALSTTASPHTCHSSNAQVQNVAISCIDLWTDVFDVKSIPESSFRDYRIFRIYEKYVMFGATAKVPLSRSVQDDLSNRILGTNQSNFNYDIFDDAVSEALDFLVSEVYFACKQISIGKQAKDHTFQLIKVITKGTKPARSGKYLSLTSEVIDIINCGGSLLKAFRTFLKARGFESTLVAYIKAIELRESLQLHRDSEFKLNPDGDVAVYRAHRCMKLEEFYDSYIAAGAKLKSNLPEAVKGDFLRRLTRNSDTVDFKALSVIEDACLYEITSSHWNDFLQTKEYSKLHTRNKSESAKSIKGVNFASLSDKLMGIGRSERENTPAVIKSDQSSTPVMSNSILATIRLPPINSVSRVVGNASNHVPQTLFGHISNRLDETARFLQIPIRSRKEVLKVSSENVTARRCESNPELLTEIDLLLSSGLEDAFGIYLEQYGSVNTMHFYQSAARYSHSLELNSSIERKIQCEEIYRRYVSRTSEELVEFPDDIRQAIANQLLEPSKTIFRRAQNWALEDICNNHWLEFKSEVFARANWNKVANLDGQTLIGNGSSRSHGDMNSLPSCQSVEVYSSNDAIQENHFPPIKHDHSFATVDQSDNQLPTDDSDSDESVGINVSIDKSSTCSYKRFISISSKVFRSEGTEALRQCDMLGSASSPSMNVNGIHHGDKDYTDGTSRSKERFGNSSTESAADIHPNRQELRRGAVVLGDLEMASVLSALRTQPRRTQAQNDSYLIMRKDIALVFKLSFREVLDDCTLCSMFKRFLEQENMPYTLTFLVEHEHYICILDSATQQARAWILYRKYIHDQSWSPLPIKQSTRDDLTIQLESGSCSSYELARLFENVVKEILNYIEFRQYRLFLNSRYVEEIHELLSERKMLVDSEIVVEASKNIGRRSLLRKLFSFRQSADYSNADHYVVAGSNFRRVASSMLGLPLIGRQVDLGDTGANSISQGSRLLHRRMSHEIAFIAAGAVKPARRASVTNGNIHKSDLRTAKQLLSFQTTAFFLKGFCQATYCAENIMFWLDAESFASLPESVYLRRIAFRLYVKFIDAEAPYQVNICSDTLKEIQRDLNAPHALMFRKAQSEILRLMETDSMPKFLVSSQYAQMIARLQVQDCDINTFGIGSGLVASATAWIPQHLGNRLSLLNKHHPRESTQTSATSDAVPSRDHGSSPQSHSQTIFKGRKSSVQQN